MVADHTPTRRLGRRGGGERGSQALEFAMVLPLFGLLLVLLAQTGLLLGDVVAAQGIAREVARTAVVADPAAARQVGRDLAGRREVRIEVSDADGLVEVQLELRSSVFSSTGVDVWLPARAVMRQEGTVSDVAGG